ncbi:MAG TPA: hypothetical protein VGU20_19550 [Stellaceae bacterium]|nr:hypothetical protein [Stellaceae bacterium]
MKLLPLVWAMLWRKKARTLLTFGSIAVAFLLFALLEAFASVFATGARFAGATNLDTLHRFGFIKPLPYAYRSKPPPRPRISTARTSRAAALLRPGMSFTGKAMAAPFVSSVRSAHS